jgi:hypothetical protein
MDTDFKIILEFFAQSQAEVEGRAATVEPQAEDAELLNRFASGGCSPEERAEACDLIRRHPTWLGWISHRVKALRFNTDGPTHFNGAHPSHS